MAEIQVIQHHEDVDQPQVIIIMVRWNLALATVFFKGFLLTKRYKALNECYLTMDICLDYWMTKYLK